MLANIQSYTYFYFYKIFYSRKSIYFANFLTLISWVNVYVDIIMIIHFLFALLRFKIYFHRPIVHLFDTIAIAPQMLQVR